MMRRGGVRVVGWLTTELVREEESHFYGGDDD